MVANLWDEAVSETEQSAKQPCTECGNASGGYTCCSGDNHPLCEACATVLEDGYQYCSRHLQLARDEIAEREVYNALAGLHQACLRREPQAYRSKELIRNLGKLAHFYMHSIKPLDAQEYDEAKDDLE